MFRPSATAVAIFKQAGIPHFSVSLSGMAMLIGVGLNYVMPERLFGYLLTMVAWLILLVWANITLTHLLYRRAVSRNAAWAAANVASRQSRPQLSLPQ